MSAFFCFVPWVRPSDEVKSGHWGKGVSSQRGNRQRGRQEQTCYRGGARTCFFISGNLSVERGPLLGTYTTPLSSYVLFSLGPHRTPSLEMKYETQEPQQLKTLSIVIKIYWLIHNPTPASWSDYTAQDSPWNAMHSSLYEVFWLWLINFWSLGLIFWGDQDYSSN